MSKKAINFQTPYTAASLIDYLGGSTLETAVCWKLTPKRPVRGPKDVNWQSVVGLGGADGVLCVGASGGGDDWGARGASSIETFADEGGLTFRRGSRTAQFFVGLSPDDASRHYTDIDFAWFLSSVGGAAMVYEGGVLRHTVSPLPPPTAVYGVRRLWSYPLARYEIHYTVDDEVVYTSSLLPAAALRVDTAFSARAAGACVEVRLTQPVTAIGATSHGRDLVLPGHAGLVFKSSRGGNPTTIDTERGHHSAGLQVESVFDDETITERSIEAGDWAGAKFEIYTVNLKALGMGQLVEFSGRLGKVDTEGPAFTAEARPLTSVASGQIGFLDAAKCNVRHFADAHLENRCKLSRNATAFDGYPITVTGAVTNGESSTQFVDSSRSEPADHFTMGEVTFTTGPLAGRTYEVREYDAANKRFTLRRAAPVLIGTGWAYSAVRGCRRTAGDCINKYANIINHRAERFVTSIERINEIERAA